MRETGEQLLLVDDGMIDIGWGLSKIVTMALPDVESRLNDPFSPGWQEVQEHLTRNPGIYRRFKDLIDAARSRKHPYFADSYLLR